MFLVEIDDILHISGRSQKDGTSLVNVGGNHVQNGDFARGGFSPSLLHQIGHGVALVQQT